MTTRNFKQILYLVILAVLFGYVFNQIQIHSQLLQGDKNLAVDEGRQYLPSLQNLWVQTLYEPVLALPGSDLAELKLAATELEQSLDLFIHLYPAEEAQIIQEQLYPIEFLKSLSEVEEARRAYGQQPNVLRAISYHLQLRNSLLALERYTAEASNIFLDMTSGVEYVFFAGRTNNSHIAAELAQMHLTAREQRRGVQRRLLCALGLWWSDRCAYHHMPVQSITENNNNDDFTPSSTGIQIMKDYLVNYKEDSFSVTDTPPQELPIVVLNDAMCTQSSDTAYAFVWREARPSGLPYLFSTPSEEIIFHDASQSKDALHEAMHEAGLTYEYQSMNPYMCIDSALDSGTVRAAYYIQTELAENRYFTKPDLQLENEKFAVASELEQEIIESNKLLDSSVVGEYINLIAVLLLNDRTALLETLGVDNYLALLELTHAWRAKSAWLETDLNRLSDMAVTLEYISDQIHIQYEQLFGTRSYLSVTLLAGNKTLYPQEISFLSLHEPMELADGAYLTQTEVMAALSLEPEAVAEFMYSQDLIAGQVYKRSSD